MESTFDSMIVFHVPGAMGTVCTLHALCKFMIPCDVRNGFGLLSNQHRLTKVWRISGYISR